MRLLNQQDAARQQGSDPAAGQLPPDVDRRGPVDAAEYRQRQYDLGALIPLPSLSILHGLGS